MSGSPVSTHHQAAAVPRSLERSLSVQYPVVMAQMIFNKCRDEIIAVIIARLAPQRERIAHLLGGLLQQMRVELGLEKLIGGALID